MIILMDGANVFQDFKELSAKNNVLMVNGAMLVIFEIENTNVKSSWKILSIYLSLSLFCFLGCLLIYDSSDEISTNVTKNNPLTTTDNEIADATTITTMSENVTEKENKILAKLPMLIRRIWTLRQRVKLFWKNQLFYCFALKLSSVI